jgi:hypothetical protein
MTPLIFSISLLMAFCVAGLVWYGWGFAENILVLRKSKQPTDEADEEQDSEEE